MPSPEQLQHAAEQLTRAVHVIFGEWTALRLAIENEWAGGGTRERALALLQRVRDGLLASAVVHRDELEDVLDNALVDDFNIEADDESPQEIAVLLCALHTEARAGVTKTADVLLARSAGKRTWVEVPPPPRQRGEDDSSDEDIDDDVNDGGGGGTSAMDEDMGGVPAAPEVDEDGAGYGHQSEVFSLGMAMLYACAGAVGADVEDVGAAGDRVVALIYNATQAMRDKG